MITLSEIRQINKEFRSKDDSHLWPILNKFNVTERAIRILRKERKLQEFMSSYEYWYALDSLISKIVNDSINW